MVSREQVLLESLPAEVPEGWTLAGVSGERASFGVRLALMVRAAEGDKPARLDVIRETHDARVYLAALADEGGRVHCWLEAWVQEPMKPGGVEGLVQLGLCNRLLDEAWRSRAEALADVGVLAPFVTGWERSHPAPLFLAEDGGGWRAACPRCESGEAWRLCTSPERLAAAGKRAYEEDLARWLHVPERADLGVRSAPVLATGVAGRIEAGDGSALGLSGRLIPVNPTGGLMMFRPLAGRSYEDQVNILSSHGGGMDSRRRGLAKTEAGARAAMTRSGRLFVGDATGGGRLLEALHLKLRLFADAVGQVRSYVERTRMPLLNVEGSSFRVEPGPEGTGLPSMWMSRAVLAQGGESARLSLEGADLPYFMPVRRRAVNIWRPNAMNPVSRSSTSLDLLQVHDTSRGTVFEATMVKDEQLEARKHDLIRLIFTADSERIELFAVAVSEQMQATSMDLYIRSLPARLSESARAALNVGVSYAPVAYTVIPYLGSPADLHGLSVLGVRTFLAGNGRDMGAFVAAKKGIASLGREAGALRRSMGEKAALAERIGAVLEKYPDLTRSLGPQNLVWSDQDAPTYEQALGVVTRPVWIAVLAMLVRMVPELSPDSTCQDMGYADPSSLHRVFDPALQELDWLILRTRMQLLSEQYANKEIGDVLLSKLQELG